MFRRFYSGFITLTRLTGDEITGTESSAGIIEKYFSLSQEDTTCLQDITLGAGEMKIGDNYLCLHTLSDPEDLPTSVATDSRYERLSTYPCQRLPGRREPHQLPTAEGGAFPRRQGLFAFRVYGPRDRGYREPDLG